jgi:hypothetical protein
MLLGRCALTRRARRSVALPFSLVPARNTISLTINIVFSRPNDSDSRSLFSERPNRREEGGRLSTYHYSARESLR